MTHSHSLPLLSLSLSLSPFSHWLMKEPPADESDWVTLLLFRSFSLSLSLSLFLSTIGTATWLWFYSSLAVGLFYTLQMKHQRGGWETQEYINPHPYSVHLMIRWREKWTNEWMNERANGIKKNREKRNPVMRLTCIPFSSLFLSFTHSPSFRSHQLPIDYELTVTTTMVAVEFTFQLYSIQCALMMILPFSKSLKLEF